MPGGVIALDAMGGDHAPRVTVAGAVQASREHDVEVVLVGRPEELAAELVALGFADGLPIVAAADVVHDDEEPALALRTKRGASVRVAAGLVADGRASALVSAGSTGGTLAAALLVLGRSGSIRRPVVAAVLPVGVPGVVLVDAGGSADPQPDALLASARAGRAYARVLGVTTPRVGLLSVGGEPGKGNALVRAAHGLLAGQPWFSGNVEPAQVLTGDVDVVVADGFTGNVFLKTYETLERRRGDKGPGAAALLGVAGEVFVAHGSAGEDDIAAAVRTAAAASARGLASAVADELSAVPGG